MTTHKLCPTFHNKRRKCPNRMRRNYILSHIYLSPSTTKRRALHGFLQKVKTKNWIFTLNAFATAPRRRSSTRDRTSPTQSMMLCTASETNPSNQRGWHCAGQTEEAERQLSNSKFYYLLTRDLTTKYSIKRNYKNIMKKNP